MQRLSFFPIWLLAVALAMGQESRQASSYLLDGGACLDRGDYEASSHLFEQAYNWEPTLQAAFGAGVSYFKLKRFSEAELWFQKASAIDPDSEETAVYLATSQIANYKPAEARGLLEDFVRSHAHSVHAAATLEALKADLGPRNPGLSSRSGNALYLACAAAIFSLLFFGSFLLSDAGLRTMGRGMGWSALTSVLLMFSLPGILSLLGYLGGVFLCARGWREHRFHTGRGSWARKVRLDLFRVLAVFELVSGRVDQRRIHAVLKGLVKAGLNKSIIREIEVQLQNNPIDLAQADVVLQGFSRDERRFRREVLRLLSFVSVEIGWDGEQKELLTDFAKKLQLQQVLPSMLAELGIGEEEEKTQQTPPRKAAKTQLDPLLPYFRILEIPPSADRNRVKSGYRRQARRYHPDVLPAGGGAAGSTAQFLKVHEAYQQICKARGWED